MSRNIKILKTEILNNKSNNKRFIFTVSKKKKVYLFLLLLLTLSLLLIPRDYYKSSIRKLLAMAGIYTEEIKSVEIQSNDYDDPGSYKITKSAKWISTNKVQITFDVDSVIKTGDNYKDVILVLDNSKSMGNGEKLTKAIADSKNLINILLDDEHNRVALINFNSTSQVLSGFTNEKETILSLLDTITSTGGTNYCSPLQNVDSVMQNYIKQSNTEVVVLFLTDGRPTENSSPSEVAIFTSLKDKYPYLTINGVQYEMGKAIINELKAISDNQFIADKTNLRNVLLEASISPITYEEFIIEDYINTDYFNITSTNDINTSIGDATIVEEEGEKKIVWNLGNNSYMTGSHKKMTINLTLNDTIPSNKVFYPSNTKEEITSKLPGEEEQTKSSTDTPVLTNKYNVIYDTNTPDGCVISNVPSEEYKIYQTITKNTNEISCSGYLFKGWKIDTEDDSDITHINEDLFIMPSHDVTVRAEWSGQSITKGINGTVNTHATLYKVLKDEAENGSLALEYTGDHQDSMDSSKSTEKIYHWTAGLSSAGERVQDKNNVIFADHCWKIVRTTDTGGVRMMYNGEVEDGKCLSGRSPHVGYSSAVTQTINSNYWYGTDYEYDPTNSLFSLSGTTEQATWSDSTSQGLIGKYTCKLGTESGTCSTLYLIESYSSSTDANIITLNSNSHSATYGILPFNAKTNFPSYLGYMYGDIYGYTATQSTNTESFAQTETVLTSLSIGTSLAYFYSDSYSYDSNTGLYSLNNPYQLTSVEEYPNLVGKYTFRYGDGNNSEAYIYYIVGVSNNILSFKRLENGNSPSNFEPIVFGDSITDNGNGTYTLNNTTTTTLSNWYNNHSNYVNKYTCNSTSNTCAEPRYLTSTTDVKYTYINAGEKIMIGKSRNNTTLTNTLLVRKDELIINKENYSDYILTCNTTTANCTEQNLRVIDSITDTGYVYAPNHYYGSSVTWDGTNYTLVNPIGLEYYNDLESISTHHYICLEEGAKTCQNVGYIYYYTGSGKIYALDLENGNTSISSTLESMFENNINNSTIKSGVEAWYKKYLLDYDNMIEDTIYCNNRTTSNLGGWDTNGGMTNINLTFNNGATNSDLSCLKTTDKFSVSNSDARLAYKVGLISSAEMAALNFITSISRQNTWLISPAHYAINDSRGLVLNFNGKIVNHGINVAYGVRPAISLKPGTEYYTGDGSMENPYIVDIEE